MIAFIHKWLKHTVFTYQIRTAAPEVSKPRRPRPWLPEAPRPYLQRHAAVVSLTPRLLKPSVLDNRVVCARRGAAERQRAVVQANAIDVPLCELLNIQRLIAKRACTRKQETPRFSQRFLDYVRPEEPVLVKLLVLCIEWLIHKGVFSAPGSITPSNAGQQLYLPVLA